MPERQMSSTQTRRTDQPAPPAEPGYQLQRATARLEAALQSLDLEAEAEQAEAIIRALRTTDRVRDRRKSGQRQTELTNRRLS
jgi:hypothetical protein